MKLLRGFCRAKMKTMQSGQKDLPVQIESEVGSLISALCTAGWTVFFSRYDFKSFGNWLVDLQCAEDTIRLVKDRSQYFIEGSKMQEIKAAGLWRTFDDLDEFNESVMKWIASSNSSI